jgi:hypothetical protein
MPPGGGEEQRQQQRQVDDDGTGGTHDADDGNRHERGDESHQAEP